MKLLFIVPYVPSLIRTRSYNLLRQLVRHGHQVTLATGWSDTREREQLALFESEGLHILATPLTRARSAWNCLKSVPRPIPLQAVYAWQPELLNLLQAAIRDPHSHFDLIHVEHLRGARYGTHLQSGFHSPAARIPVVWDSVDCISYLFEQAARSNASPFGRWVARFELPRTRWYEAWLVGQFDRVLISSEKDRGALYDLLQQFTPALATSRFSFGQESPWARLSGWSGKTDAEKIHLLPNGVDLEYFKPCEAPPERRTIIFTGKMSYHANVTAALHLVNEIMPRVWEKNPGVCLQIVGQNPPSQVVRLARQNSARVSVIGSVADLRPYLAQAALSVVPLLYGAGSQLKVLEAMAMAKPVVATSKAVAAFTVRNEEEVLIGDDDELFSQHIIRLLRNPALGERLGRNGRRYVEMNHDWDGIANQLEGIYQEAIAERKCVA